MTEQLTSVFDGIEIKQRDDDLLELSVQKEALLALLSFVKNQGYNHLALISCVDWIEENAFELLYILSPYMKDDEKFAQENSINIVVKTRIPRASAKFLSVIPIFAIAEPYEREIHELFGIHFEGHPRLTPLFLERKYPIPPFRKDFDTQAYVRRVFDRIPFVEKKAENR